MSRKPKNEGVGADSWVHNQRKGESRKTLERRIAKHRRQRSEAGYSWNDWISFDTFLAGIIANGMRDFRLNGIGYPGGMTPEEWNDILLRIENPLSRWAADKFEADHETEKIKYSEAQEAIRLLAEHFGHFWD